MNRDSQQNTTFYAPIYEALLAMSSSNPVSFHVPGHKYGQSLTGLHSEPSIDMESIRGIMEIDLTELPGTDDLHAPAGIIAEAQTLAASTFGAEETFFLIGGSTVGNLAMILSTCEIGDQIIIQRNAHKSVLNGLALAGAQAIFIMPQMDHENGLEIVPELTLIEEALKLFPAAKAVFLTNPSYYGFSVDLQPYANLIHQYGKLLLVDEAHGAHYGLHPDFPNSALQAGADAVVQSTHKTLPALTMGAMLHVQGERMDRESLRHVLRMVQSSSPSYPILASLDIARALVDTMKASLFDSGLRAAAAFRKWIKENGSSFGIVENWSHHDVEVRLDPLRIVIEDLTGRYTGFELLEHLQYYGCWAEMADSKHVVLLVGLAALEADIERLKDAMTGIANHGSAAICRKESHPLLWTTKSNKISEPVTIPRKLPSESEVDRIGLSDAVGRRAAESIIPYPPGIPIVYMGEYISAETVQYVKRLAIEGAKFQGAVDPAMHTIAVMKGS
ncbi:lysine decarboxylase [Paenibacillus baekrokdamisoli]|uniref:Lysine decarboxylase n=1 Tax=Paenibacillus baekrokdamisoli TaxID=1712516 RepID=A0A3G9JEH5_9BACL|nr:aminotransferase class I/II-fold pyridoxal phosphate-dependent enzyme [Paenibacillus baekrokdamisoli]MBB3072957.1 arginine/lysine/ornithine decarboxylase [Paenibacillus baekrokdamisoli]BBH23373.1 lysine decarboxylase [Paenibacillus baekrokdamisoli]